MNDEKATKTESSSAPASKPDPKALVNADAHIETKKWSKKTLYVCTECKRFERFDRAEVAKHLRSNHGIKAR